MWAAQSGMFKGSSAPLKGGGSPVTSPSEPPVSGPLSSDSECSFGSPLHPHLPWRHNIPGPRNASRCSSFSVPNGKALTPEHVFFCADQLVRKGRTPPSPPSGNASDPGAPPPSTNILISGKPSKISPPLPRPRPPSSQPLFGPSTQRSTGPWPSSFLPCRKKSSPSRTRRRSGPGRSSVWSPNGRPSKSGLGR